MTRALLIIETNPIPGAFCDSCYDRPIIYLGEVGFKSIIQGEA